MWCVCVCVCGGGGGGGGGGARPTYALLLSLIRCSTLMSIVVVVSPLKALVLDQVTFKHLVHTGPGISCILLCPTSLYNR